MNLCRYRDDLWSILFLASTLGIQLLAITSGLPWWVFVLPFASQLRAVCLIQHNHVHVPVFHHRHANELFSLACFFVTGVPSDGYIAHHVMAHHRWNNLPGKDPSSIYAFSGAHYPDKPVSVLRYVVTFPFRTVAWSVRYLVQEAPTFLRRRFFRSLILVGGLVTWLFSHHPVETLLFVGLPWVVVGFSLGYNNYKHHAGCDMQNSFQAAMNNLTPSGVVGFGIGYHTAHHLRPGLHWSQLFELHLRIHHRIPTKYIRT